MTNSSKTPRDLSIEGFRLLYLWDDPYRPANEVLARDTLSPQAIKKLELNPLTGRTSPPENHVSLGGMTREYSVSWAFIMALTIFGGIATAALLPSMGILADDRFRPLLTISPGALLGFGLGQWLTRWRHRRDTERIRAYQRFRQQHASEILSTTDPVATVVVEALRTANRQEQEIAQSGAVDLLAKMPPLSDLAGQVISARLTAQRPTSDPALAQAQNLLAGTNPADDTQALSTMRQRLETAHAQARPLNDRVNVLLGELAAANTRTSELSRSARARTHLTTQEPS